MKPKSTLTPTFQYYCTVRGHHVFKHYNSYSIDEKVQEDELEAIIDYMLSEGLLYGDDWHFLT